MIVFRLVDTQGNALTTGPEETLSHGEGSSRGVFASNVPVACEIDLVRGATRSIRAAAIVMGKFPNRRPTAAVEMH